MVDKEKKKIGRPMPDWLLNLPKGDYYLADLVKISGKTWQNCSKTMSKYCSKYEYIRDKQVKILYHWDGFSKPLLR